LSEVFCHFFKVFSVSLFICCAEAQQWLGAGRPAGRPALGWFGVYVGQGYGNALPTHLTTPKSFRHF